MKRVFILLGLLAALQLSAQNPGFRGENDQQPGNDGQQHMDAPAPGPQGMRGKAFGPQGRPGNRPPHFQGKGADGFFPTMPLDQLSEQDRAVVEGYMKDLHHTVGKMENELFLKKAELRYLTHIEQPDINQISAKLDEIGKLESSIQLERIKFDLKVKQQFPALSEHVKHGPGPQAPAEGASVPNARPDKFQAKKK